MGGSEKVDDMFTEHSFFSQSDFAKKGAIY